LKYRSTLSLENETNIQRPLAGEVRGRGRFKSVRRGSRKESENPNMMGGAKDRLGGKRIQNEIVWVHANSIWRWREPAKVRWLVIDGGAAS